MEIVKAPNDVLSQIANPVNKVDKSVRELIEEMKTTLANTHDPEGVGLAAPQVGKSLRIFIMKPNQKTPVTVCINPVIELLTGGTGERAPDSADAFAPRSGKTSGALAGIEHVTGPAAPSKKQTKLEGCLSLTNIWGDVIRQREITISYLDETGKQKTKTFKGFSATIVQHEMDHLLGILFPKRVLEQKGIMYKSKKNDKGEDIFEEIEI